MELSQLINKIEKCLVLCKEDEQESYLEILQNSGNISFRSISQFPSEQNDSVDSIICSGDLPDDSVSMILKVLKPGGRLIIEKVTNIEKMKFELTTKGFMNVSLVDNRVIATKPNFAPGSSAKLNLSKKPVPAVWKLDDDNEETIDSDLLLDDDDLKKPDPASLKVCGTTGKQKACKDCSCGLAEELTQEMKSRKVIDTTEAPKSSCGSCYLGDAFRCSTCPYLGMPAFKPGEKIQLVGNQLENDI